jgi:YD repeat-containing protein
MARFVLSFTFAKPPDPSLIEPEHEIPSAPDEVSRRMIALRLGCDLMIKVYGWDPDVEGRRPATPRTIPKASGTRKVGRRHRGRSARRTMGTRSSTRDATGHAVRQVVDPGRGQTVQTVDQNSDDWALADDKTSRQRYDSLGRLVGVTLPGDPNETVVFEYTFANLGPSRVKRSVQVNNGQWVDSYTYFDGLGRERETQVPGPNGGRLISAKQYDGRSQVVREFAGQYHSAAPGSGMWTGGAAVFTGSALTRETRMTVDNLGRVTEVGLYGSDAPVLANGVHIRTRTAYDGMWATVTPAVGSQSRSHTNPHGQVDITSKANTTWSGWKDTTYVYDLNGNLIATTDPLANVTTQTFDNHGRMLTRRDPDAGLTTMTYNPAGLLTSSTDALGVQVNYVNDGLGRPTAITSAGATLESYVYDAPGEKGLLNYASSFHNGAELRIDTLGYDARSRPRGYSNIIPSIAGVTDNGLAGTYTYDRLRLTSRWRCFSSDRQWAAALLFLILLLAG